MAKGKNKPIPLEEGETEERCCFCRTATKFWTDIKSRQRRHQVACCNPCAITFRQLDVPSKKYWFLLEEVLLKKASASAFVAGRRSAIKEIADQQMGNTPAAE